MDKPWEQDSCKHVQSYYTVYPVPAAAALWCRIPENEVQQHLAEATAVGRAVYRHPYIPCLEPRCRAIHEAIEKGALHVSRGNGKSIDGTTEHVAHERRHVTRQDLKEWIAREFPSDKPPFLFDEVERNAHAAINADSFRALQADRDALRVDIQKVRDRCEAQLRELDALRGERDSLRAMVDGQTKAHPRAEAIYLNIIGGLLDLMLRTTPAGNRGSVYGSQAAIISALLAHHGGTPGIADSTLEQKFAAANQSIKAT
jgi:hypothetical protein